MKQRPEHGGAPLEVMEMRNGTGRPAAICSVAVLLLAFAWGAWGRERRGDGEVERLRDEVHLLNLLNGLYLTQDQAGKILDVVREADHARGVLQRRGDELKGAGLAPLRALRSSLLRGSNVEESVLGPFHMVQQRAHTLKESYEAHVDKLVGKVADVLTPNQVHLIETYKPCLAPPREQTHPDRIGSAEATGERMGHLLDKLRGMGPEQASARLDAFIRRHAHRPELRRAGVTAESLKSRIETVVAKARAMDDLGYESSREDLLAEARPPGLERRDPEERGPGVPLRKIRNLFFFPGAVDLLEERLHFMRDHAVWSKVDLTRIEGAHNCTNRRCALNE